MHDLDARHFGGQGQQIFAVIGGLRLAVLVIDHPLEQRIADAMDHAAPDLAIDQHRVDQRAAIMGNDIAQDLDRAGFDIHLDLAQIGAIGESGLARLVKGGGRQARRNACGQRLPEIAVQHQGQLAERDLTIGSGHFDKAAFEHQIGLLRFQHLRGHLDRLGAGFHRRHMHRGATRHRHAAGNRADAERKQRGITRFHRDVLRGDAELVGGNLGKHGFVALPLCRGPCQQQHLAIGLNADGGPLVRGQTGIFDIRSDAHADIAAFGARFVLTGLEIGPEFGDRQIKTLHIITRVIGHRRAVTRFHTGFIGKLVELNEGTATDILARHPQFPRHPIGQTFEHETGIGTPRPAHRRIGHYIGVDHINADLECLERIGTGERRHRRHRQHHAVGQIGPVVMQAMAAHAEHAALRIGGDFQLPQLVALLGGGHEMLAAILDPFQRTAQMARRQRDRIIFGIDHRFGPEPAADIGGCHPHRGLVHAKAQSQRAPHHVRRLGRTPDIDPVARRIGPRHDTATFHRMTAAAMQRQAFLEHMRRFGEHARDIAEAAFQRTGQIALQRLIGHGRALIQGMGQIDHRRQRIVIDHHHRGRIFGNRTAFGHDKGHRLADIMDRAMGQRALGQGGFDHRRGGHHRHRLAGHLAEIVGGQHCYHTGMPARHRSIDGVDQGMGMG